MDGGSATTERDGVADTHCPWGRIFLPLHVVPPQSRGAPVVLGLGDDSSTVRTWPRITSTSRRNEWRRPRRVLQRRRDYWQEYLRVLRMPKEWVEQRSNSKDRRGTGRDHPCLSDVPERDRTFNDGQALVVVANTKTSISSPLPPAATGPGEPIGRR